MNGDDEEEKVTVLKRSSNIRHTKDLKEKIQIAGKNSIEVTPSKSDQKIVTGLSTGSPVIPPKKVQSFNAAVNANELVQAVRSASMTNTEYKKKLHASGGACAKTSGDTTDKARKTDEDVIDVFRSFR